jgi:hypothetical protein
MRICIMRRFGYYMLGIFLYALGRWESRAHSPDSLPNANNGFSAIILSASNLATITANKSITPAGKAAAEWRDNPARCLCALSSLFSGTHNRAERDRFLYFMAAPVRLLLMVLLLLPDARREIHLMHTPRSINTAPRASRSNGWSPFCVFHHSSRRR